MAPRRAASDSPRSNGSSRSTRSSRSNPMADPLPPPPRKGERKADKKPAMSQRRPMKTNSKGRKTTAIQRRTRPQQASDEDPDSASESGTDGDKEDGNGDEKETDGDEAEADAPSGNVRPKRGHQTGLSLTLSHTTLSNMRRGGKRELSLSTIDGDERRPAKQAKTNATAESSNEEDENDSSDDDAYNAVDDISESEDNASDIERVEEQNIISSVERTQWPVSDDGWAGVFRDGMNVDDESPFFTEHFAVTEPNSEFEFAVPGAAGTTSSMPSPASAPARRVRFVGVSSSSSSGMDSDVDEAAFPDLVFDQEHLHPSTRQLFEIETETQQLSDESFWDLDARDLLPVPDNQRLQPESTDDFSGYETDSSGQTTDDEAVPPLTVHRPQYVLRLNANESRDKGPRVRRANPAARSLPRAGKGPCMGTWVADPSKPIGVIHPETKRMVYIAAPAPSLPYAGVSHNFSGDSSPTTAYIDMSRKPWPRQPWGAQRKSSDSDSSNRPSSFDGAHDDFNVATARAAIMNGLPASLVRIGAADAFYAVDHAVIDEDDDEDEDDEDEEDPDEAQLDIDAFIDFGEHDSDSNDNEGDGEIDELASPVTPLSSQRLPTITPKRSRGRSSSQNLLEHFDKGVVSAFRRNQNRHQAVLRRPVAGARIQAIKGGRLSAADVPITPIRKRKPSHSLSSPMAPFTGINTSRLRSGTT